MEHMASSNHYEALEKPPYEAQNFPLGMGRRRTTSRTSWRNGFRAAFRCLKSLGELDGCQWPWMFMVDT